MPARGPGRTPSGAKSGARLRGPGMAGVTAKELQRHWRAVRKAYFPRWDLRGEWKVQAVPGSPCNGECSSEKKLITLTPPASGDRTELDLVLIHEVCHVWAN